MGAQQRGSSSGSGGRIWRKRGVMGDGQAFAADQVYIEEGQLASSSGGPASSSTKRQLTDAEEDEAERIYDALPFDF